MAKQKVATAQIELSDLTDCGLNQNEAEQLIEPINAILQKHKFKKCWKRLYKDVLKPSHPFALHRMLYETVYEEWETMKEGPPPAWLPSRETLHTANINKIRDQVGLDSYQEFYSWSVCHRSEFWETMVQNRNIKFKNPYSKIVKVEDNLEQPEWLADAELNIADSCFDALGDTTAIVYQEKGGEIKRMTYQELDNYSNRVANALIDQGLKKGNAVAVDMVMTAEAVAIYLGIVKAGGVVVSIADSLAAPEIEKRLSIAKAKLIFTQDVMVRGEKEIPLYPKVLEASPKKAIVLPGKQKLEADLRDQDESWSDFLSDKKEFNSVPCDPDDHCNILFSSGTTGTPKAIPWTHTTPIRCITDGYLHQNIKRQDVVAWPTNIGWMMGPWLIFAALGNNATIALYYDLPTERGFGEFVENADVNMLGVVPSMVKQWKESGCMDGLDWNSVKCFSSTGEASNPVDYHWLMARAGYRPVIEYCGGTEVGGGYATGAMVQPAAPATFSTPALGIDFVVLNQEGKQKDSGELFLIPPSIGLSQQLLNKDNHDVYYKDVPKLPKGAKGVYGDLIQEEVEEFNVDPIIRKHGDEIEKLPLGYARALGRADDTMNLGGIKVGSAEIERKLEVVENVRETAAIAVDPSDGGPSQLVIYAVLEEGKSTDEDSLKKTFQKVIKEDLNPLFKVRDVVIKEELPRTASNKVMRRVLRDEYNEE